MRWLWIALVAIPACAQQYRAFWADAFHDGFKNPSQVEQLLDDAVTARANAIFVQARRRADSYYLDTLEVPAQDSAYSPRFDALRYMIERAHSRGIEVHAWFIVYPVWPTAIAPPANPEHLWYKHGPGASGDEMWMAVGSNGTVAGSLDPGHPAAQRYLAEVITDPITKYDIDGIHLDYIRYSEDPANYAWNPKSVERFVRLAGRAERPAPADPAWADFRRRQVTDLVREIYLRAIEAKPAIKVSAALISWGNGPLNDAGWRSSDAYRTVSQDWRSWMEEGILDLAIPMHYFRESANAGFLDRWLNFANDRQFNRRYLPGLAPYMNSIPESLAQLGRALSTNATGNTSAGVCFYSYASTNTLDAAGVPITPNRDFYRAVGEWFGGPAAIPVLPWKEHPVTGHLAGVVTVDEGPEWLADGVTVEISSDTGADFARTAVTSGTGFFGFVDLPPDRYQVRFQRNGELLERAVPVEVVAGRVARSGARLRQ